MPSGGGGQSGSASLHDHAAGEVPRGWPRKLPCLYLGVAGSSGGSSDSPTLAACARGGGVREGARSCSLPGNLCGVSLTGP